MPYVLINKSTSEIYTCTLVNIYKFPYHGTKFWDFEDEAEEGAAPFLSGQGQNPADWELLEVEENKLKVFNVKLNNNAARRLFLDEGGRPVVHEA